MAKIASLQAPDSGEPTSKCRMIVVGSTVDELIRGEQGFGNYAEIVANFPDLAAWAAGETPEADLLVIGCPTLFPDTIDAIQGHLDQSGAGRAIVVYGFANAETEKAASEPASRITTLRAPVTASELTAACEADIALSVLREQWAEEGDPAAAMPVAPESEEAPPRQFSEAQLAKISRVSTAIECECPHHLAALLNSLNAFEDYSKGCVNRNEEDALLHDYLYRSTANARSIVEDALVVLAEAEGIEV